MEQLTKNQAVATSQEAVQNQNEPQLRDENAHNDKSVHGVLNPTYQAGLRRRSEERFSRNAETDLVCRLLLEKKKEISRIQIQRKDPDLIIASQHPRDQAALAPLARAR